VLVAVLGVNVNEVVQTVAQIEVFGTTLTPATMQVKVVVQLVEVHVVDAIVGVVGEVVAESLLSTVLLG
jgi:hypothetical protein